MDTDLAKGPAQALPAEHCSSCKHLHCVIADVKRDLSLCKADKDAPAVFASTVLFSHSHQVLLLHCRWALLVLCKNVRSPAEAVVCIAAESGRFTSIFSVCWSGA